MPNNPNNLDFYSNNEIFPYLRGTKGTNNLDFFNNNEVFPYIYVISAPAPPPPVISNKRRRIMITD